MFWTRTFRFSSLQRPTRRQRKPRDSILKNGGGGGGGGVGGVVGGVGGGGGSYSSLPRGYSLRNWPNLSWQDKNNWIKKCI